MFKVVGKAFFETNYNGVKTRRVRYTLQIPDDEYGQRHFESVQGSICETVSLKDNEVNRKPKIGDSVVVSYDVYNGRKFANGIFIV